MRIAVDIRSLIEPCPSGISEYTYQLLSHLLAIDKENKYLLFCNARKKINSRYIKAFSRANVDFIFKRVPNKLFNTGLFLFNAPKLDRLVPQADIFFMPSLTFSAFSPGVKLALAVHDISFTYPGFYSVKGRWWHKFIKPKKIMNRAEAIIAVSDSTKAELVKHYHLPPDKIKVIHSGVNADKFGDNHDELLAAVKNKYNIDKPFAFFLGTVEQRKNAETLVAAWKLFKKQTDNDYQLLIAGKSGHQAKVEDSVDIRYLGYVPEEDKPALYRLALAFIYPSFYEGFGFPVLEAMSAGLPVIASFSTSLPEIAQTAALLVDPYNIVEMAAALRQILTDENLRQQLISRGQAVARSFSWQAAAVETLKLFKSL